MNEFAPTAVRLPAPVEVIAGARHIARAGAAAGRGAVKHGKRIPGPRAEDSGQREATEHVSNQTVFRVFEKRNFVIEARHEAVPRIEIRVAVVKVGIKRIEQTQTRISIRVAKGRAEIVFRR